jgi:peptide subunit release factor 1 (eRF1)
MSSAKSLRAKLLEVGPGIVETADKLARGELKDYVGDKQVLQAMLRLVSPVIDLKDDSVDVDLADKDLKERIDSIVDALSKGDISLMQANMLVDSLAKASDAVDAVELKEALQRLANQI